MSRAAPVPGWWVDETVPDLSDVLTPKLGIDRQAFGQWLGPLLGEYRSAEHVKQATPARADELEFVREFAGLLRKVETLVVRGAPDRVQTLMVEAGNRVGISWFEVRRRLRDDLDTARLLARYAGERIKGRPISKGRKPETARDALLHAVVAELRKAGMKRTLAESLAEQVLVRCGVRTPEAPSIKRATKRVQK